MKYFNVSIHDVTSSFLNQVKQISNLLTELGIKKPTYLIIPKYHGKDDIISYANEIKDIIGNHEIAMHGYTHSGKHDWVLSYMKLFTDNEGEFISFHESRIRIALGLDILRKAKLEPKGFVPPAWLINKEDIKLFCDSCFTFLNTRLYIYDLKHKKRYRSPVLTFSSRGLLQTLSIHAFKPANYIFKNYGIIRIAIHPKDIDTPKKIKIIKQVIKDIKNKREEVYFSEFIERSQQIESM